MSACEGRFHHQNTCADRWLGFSRFHFWIKVSDSSKWTDCRHSQISARSRKYQPLPTAPCSDGGFPVRKRACMVQVTAGRSGVRGVQPTWSAKDCKLGMFPELRILGVSPTTLRMTFGFMSEFDFHQSKQGFGQEAMLWRKANLVRIYNPFALKLDVATWFLYLLQ